MSRLAAAVAVVWCLCPSVVLAQSTEFTVNLASAKVYKAPSTGSPVVGTASRGSVLEVMRHLGDWVKVTWIEAPESVGYVHLSAGSMAPRGTSAPKAGSPLPSRSGPVPSRASVASSRAVADTPSLRGTLFDPEPIGAHEPVAPSPAVYVDPPTHHVGLGGQVNGATLGFGGSARVWTRRHLGAQFDVSRFAVTNPALPGRATSVRFAPSVLYSLSDRVTDYFWLRPYLGGGFNVHRQTYNESGTPGAGLSQRKFGYQAFGGTEITFPSLAQFALSADLGYRWGAAPFPDYDLGGVGFSLSGHWYVK